MSHYAGLDVPLEETAICVVDAAGRIVKEMRAASEPEALVTALRETGLSRSAQAAPRMPQDPPSQFERNEQTICGTGIRSLLSAKRALRRSSRKASSA